MKQELSPHVVAVADWHWWTESRKGTERVSYDPQVDKLSMLWRLRLKSGFNANSQRHSSRTQIQPGKEFSLRTVLHGVKIYMKPR
jgi:hypothetical protein